ncbi:hypothetical protein KI688_006098 [Linnemannia hyalina]|uniref:Uncharacterized protein n=1 Tax=Linnemannia hyalina TaxID=64524 RepID=A0A9P7Y5S4_9FUNG|nr:hypothetical protein KI688_006098 [Linnemannia hyalina]
MHFSSFSSRQSFFFVLTLPLSLHASKLPTNRGLPNARLKRRSTFRAEGAPPKQRLRTSQHLRAPVTPTPIVITTPQPIPATANNTRARFRAPRPVATTVVSTTQPMPAIVHNTRARTPRTVPSLIASEGEDSYDEEDDNGEDDNGFESEDFDIDEETEVGVDNDIEGEANYDVEEVNDHDVVPRPISFALEKDAYLSKKRGLKETESYTSLINTLVFGGAMIDSTAVAAHADPNDIEEMEDVVLEQIKAQEVL